MRKKQNNPLRPHPIKSIFAQNCFLLKQFLFYSRYAKNILHAPRKYNPIKGTAADPPKRIYQKQQKRCKKKSKSN